MPAVIRDLSITYGSFTVGGTTNNLLDSWTRIEDGFSEAAFEMSFIVIGADYPSFVTACANAENAFRIPRQDLVVSLGASTLKSLKQSDNTGLDCNPQIRKAEHMADTGLSRRYTVRLDFGRPADNISAAGRRSTTTLVQYDSSRRRRVTVGGVYTAIPSSGTSLAQYLANIDAWALTQLQTVEPNTGISIFWELIDEPRVEYNSTNKVMEFSRTYQEKVYPDAGQTTATMDDPDLVDQVFEASWLAEGANDSPGTGVDFASQGSTSGGAVINTTGGTGDVTQTQQPTPPTPSGGASTARLGKVICIYDAAVNKNNTVDLVGKYNSVVRPWMITEAQKVVASGYGTMALMSENPRFDRDNNHIHCEMEFWVQGPAHTVEQKITTADSTPSYGWALVPRWNGNPMSKYKYRGPQQKLRIVVETRTVLGDATNQDKGSEPNDTGSSVPVSRDVKTTPRVLGLPGNQFNVTDVEITTILELYDGGSAPAPSSGTPSVPGGVPTVDPRSTGVASGSTP